MDKLKQIEINTTTSGLYFACYVYRRCGVTQFDGDDDDLYRINCVEPQLSKVDVYRAARGIAEANNVKLVDFVGLMEGKPLIETYATWNRDVK